MQKIEQIFNYKDKKTYAFFEKIYNLNKLWEIYDVLNIIKILIKLPLELGLKTRLNL